jgi:hypothetical protein
MITTHTTTRVEYILALDAEHQFRYGDPGFIVDRVAIERVNNLVSETCVISGPTRINCGMHVGWENIPELAAVIREAGVAFPLGVDWATGVLRDAGVSLHGFGYSVPRCCGILRDAAVELMREGKPLNRPGLRELVLLVRAASEAAEAGVTV